MSDESQLRSGDTVRLRRPPPRVFTDPLGHNVWMGEVDMLDLELAEVANSDPYNTADADNSWSKI